MVSNSQRRTRTGSVSHICDDDEDWTKITNSHDRKRVQNRLAQRNYRSKVRERLHELEKIKAQNDAPGTEQNSQSQVVNTPVPTATEVTPTATFSIAECTGCGVNTQPGQSLCQTCCTTFDWTFPGEPDGMNTLMGLVPGVVGTMPPETSLTSIPSAPADALLSPTGMLDGGMPWLHRAATVSSSQPSTEYFPTYSAPTQPSGSNVDGTAPGPSLLTSNEALDSIFSNGASRSSSLSSEPDDLLTPFIATSETSFAPEEKFMQLLLNIRSAGFESIEAMVLEYYTTQFRGDSVPHWIQRKSRQFTLREILVKLDQQSSSWLPSERESFQKAVLGIAQRHQRAGMR